MPLAPMFPLGSVLVPGMILPLHVFEPRYRALVGDLLEQPPVQRRFGVVAIRSGTEVGADSLRAVHEVGCVARVQSIDALDDGTFDLATVGRSRFRLRAVERRRAPYLVGRVDVLDEPLGEPAEAGELAPAVGRALLRYLAELGRLQGAPIRLEELPRDPLTVSYVVAAALVVDPTDKQSLLAAPDAVSRLREGLRLLRREIALLTSLSAPAAPQLLRAGPVAPN